VSRAIARADRVPLDAYYTPDALAKHLVGLLPLRAADVTFEPHAGGGAFIRALIPRVYSVAALDIDPNAPGLAQAHFPEVGDFLTASIPHCTWIIGNPPYSNAEAHVRRALDVTWRHVAFLLRLGFLESRKRAGGASVVYRWRHRLRRLRVVLVGRATRWADNA